MRCGNYSNSRANVALMPRAANSTPVSFTNDQIINAATGQWGEVAQEIKPAIPYVIQIPDGEAITIAPLTRRRRKKLKAAQAAYLMVGAQLGEAQNTQDVDQGTIDRIQQVLEEAEAAYDSALFGDAYQQVVDYFEDLQEEWWDAMYGDVHAKLVNRVEAPEDVCSKCGHKTEPAEGEGEEAEGKDESSSTSSTGTGTKLKAISGTT